MDLLARERVAKSLAVVFKHHDLKGHLDELRRCWRRQPGCWDDAFVERWAALMKLPGYENVIEVRPAGQPCPKCSGLFLRTGCNFPGGWTLVCGDCHHEWMVPEKSR